MRAAGAPRSRSAGAPWLVCAVLAAAASWHARAQAQTLDGLTLHWTAPSECPDEAAVRALILNHLPSGEREARVLVADARIAADGARYRMELELRGDDTHAHRTVEDRSCSALADVAALLVALALDPASATSAEGAPPPAGQAPSTAGGAPADASADRAAAAQRANEATKPAQSPATEGAGAAATKAPAKRAGETDKTDETGTRARASADADEPATSEDDAGPAIGFELGAALRLDAGMLPQTPAFGLAPQLGLRIGQLRARVAVTFWLQARVDAESYPNAALEARGLAGQGALCWELVASPVALAPCLSGELGQLELETHGISMPATSTATWTAAGAGVHAAYRATRWLQLALDALALAPFTRPRWLVHTAQEDVEVFVSARVAVRVSAAIAYIFE